MKRTHFLMLTLLPLLLIGGPSSSRAQNQMNAAGHWEGSIDIQGTSLLFSVDIMQGREGTFTATISIPSQNVKGSPLINVVAKGQEVSFAMQGVAGDPSFKGKLSEDGKTISGDITQAGSTFPFKLERKGDAKTESSWQQAYGPTPAKGVPGQGIEGRWQGTLSAGGASLRVIFKVTRGADGSYTAKLDSPDQGTPDLPVDSVTVNDKSLGFELKVIGASYKGNLSADGSEVTGEWSQGGGSLPLTLKRLETK
jgi:hypothetical protein